MSKQAKIISLFNNKGGCGKSSSALCLSHALALNGFSTLIIDNDSQANVTYVGLGLDDDSIDEENIYTIRDLFLDEDIEAVDCIQHSKFENLDIIASTIDHVDTDAELLNKDDSYRILSKKIKPIKEKYDFIIIDNSPSIFQATKNALFASDVVLSPVEPELFSLKGLRNLSKFVNKINKNRDIDLKHYTFLSKVKNSRKAKAEKAKERLQNVFEDDFIDAQISNLSVYPDSFEEGETVMNTKISSRGKEEIIKFMNALLKKINMEE